MSTATPVINLPFLYVNDLKPSYLTTTTLTVTAGQCRDSTDVFDITLPSIKTLSIAVNGVNGLDTGTIAASTMYHLFVISDPVNGNPTGLLLSLSATAPLMPFGYSAFRLIDHILTSSGSVLLKFYNTGSGSTRYKEYDARIVVSTSGVQTSYTLVDLSTAVPAIGFGKVKIHASFLPNAASDTANIQPAGATGDAITFTGQVAAVALTNSVDILPLLSTAVPKIAYKVSTGSAALTLAVLGYDYYL